MKTLEWNQLEMLEGGAAGYGASFMCNLATGGIGAVYGAWGGAIASAVFGASALASGGVTIVVGLVVGSALSAIAC